VERLFSVPAATDALQRLLEAARAPSAVEAAPAAAASAAR
jgi:hypothetical protein